MTDAYHQLCEIIKGRRSIRRFSDRPVDRSAVEKVVEAARWAPSAGNRQSYRFIAVQSKELLAQMVREVTDAAARLSQNVRAELRDEAMAYTANFTHFSRAPLVLVPIYRAGFDLVGFVTDGQSRDDRAPLDQNADALASVAAAIANLQLAAHALGLGTCWMTGPLFAGESLKRLLNVPKSWEIAALIPMGYPEEKPPAPSRRPLERLITYLD